MSAFPFHPKLSNVRHGARVGHVLSLGIRDMDHQLVRAVFVCGGGVTTQPPGPGTHCHVMSLFLLLFLVPGLGLMWRRKELCKQITRSVGIIIFKLWDVRRYTPYLLNCIEIMRTNTCFCWRQKEQDAVFKAPTV